MTKEQYPQEYMGESLALAPVDLQPNNPMVIGGAYECGYITEDTRNATVQRAMAVVNIGGSSLLLTKIEHSGRVVGAALIIPSANEGEAPKLIGVAKQGQDVRVGRQYQPELLGSHRRISREHLRLSLNENNEPVLEDLSSSNGTMIIPAALSTKTLEDSTRWAIGRYDLLREFNDGDAHQKKGSVALQGILSAEAASETGKLPSDDELSGYAFKWSGFCNEFYNYDLRYFPEDRAARMVKIYEELILQAPSAKHRSTIVEIIAEGKLGGIDIPAVMGKYDGGTYGEKIVQLAKIYNRDPELAENLVRNNIIGFHGTKSGALHGVLEHGSLLAASEARERGLSLPTGEQTYSRKGGQQFISFGDWREPGTIRRYSGKKQPLTAESLTAKMREYEKIFQGWEDNPSSRLDYMTERHPFVYNARQAIVDLKNAIELVTTRPESLEARLLVANFPVAFGVRGDFCETKTIPEINDDYRGFVQAIRSDIPGEFIYHGDEVDLRNLPVVVTVEERISELKQLFAEYGYSDMYVGDIDNLIGHNPKMSAA